MSKTILISGVTIFLSSTNPNMTKYNYQPTNIKNCHLTSAPSCTDNIPCSLTLQSECIIFTTLTVEFLWQKPFTKNCLTNLFSCLDSMFNRQWIYLISLDTARLIKLNVSLTPSTRTSWICPICCWLISWTFCLKTPMISFNLLFFISSVTSSSIRW